MGDNDKFINKKKIPPITKTHKLGTKQTLAESPMRQREKRVHTESGIRYATYVSVKDRLGGKKKKENLREMISYLETVLLSANQAISEMLFFPNQLNVFIEASLFNIASHINILLPTIPRCGNCFSTDTLSWNYSRKDRGHQGLTYTNGFPKKFHLSPTEQRLGYLLYGAFLSSNPRRTGTWSSPIPLITEHFSSFQALAPGCCPSPGSLMG